MIGALITFQSCKLLLYHIINFSACFGIWLAFKLSLTAFSFFPSLSTDMNFDADFPKHVQNLKRLLKICAISAW